MIAAAGPVNNNAVQFTANGFLVSGDLITARFPSIKTAIIINDFVACGYGVLSLDHKTEAVHLSGPKHDEEGNRGLPIACVGAGTGLGECYLTSSNRDPNTYECFASEGGHSEFAPRNDEQVLMLNYLKSKFNGRNRISIERVVSGTGLSNIYDFMTSQYPEKIDKAVHSKIINAGSMMGKLISDNSSTYELANKTMRLFASAYGSEVGVAALKWIPCGGLYITGGLTPKNMSWIQKNGTNNNDNLFMEAYRDKGRVSGLLEGIPLYAVLEEGLGLRGSWVLAVKRMREDLKVDSDVTNSISNHNVAAASQEVSGWAKLVNVGIGVAILAGMVQLSKRKDW